MNFRNKVVRILKIKGEPYRPEKWYTPTNCERQFEIILNSQTNEVKSMKPCAMLKHMCEVALKGNHILLEISVAKKFINIKLG